MAFSIVIDGVSYAWADGTPVLKDLDAAFGAGRTGLVGVNGAGKSTLLRLIAGELRPEKGSIAVDGDIGYLPQNLPLGGSRTVADLLGIGAARAALHAIERGEVTEENFAAVGDDWDVEERALAELDRLGLGGIGLDRTVNTLSGGETIMTGLAALFLRRPGVLLLDEPTNNLDLDARTRLYQAVEAWQGVMVVVSHDRALLERVDQIADMTDGGVRMYGGNFPAYQEALDIEREAAERGIRSAAADLKRQERELIETRMKLDRRVKFAKKAGAERGLPKIVRGALKRRAQVSSGKLRNQHLDKVAGARDRLADAERAMRDEAQIRITLPETEVPAGRTVLTVTGLGPVPHRAGGKPENAPSTDGAGERAAVNAAVNTGDRVDAEEADGERRLVLETLIVRGPERIALLGSNGAGKSTLLRALVGESGLFPGEVTVGVDGVGYLPQRLDALDDSLSVLDNVRRAAPSATPADIRARLARFLFRGNRVDQVVGTLSGGERFRAVLAALLSADPPPRLLLLDEPTNNLDLASVDQLTQALAAYRGALIVASHDLSFLSMLAITRWLHIDREAGLTEITGDAD
ncbi:ABC-F family ATP-binding cassette domain-containing protein [Sinosporangium siamense]|uniref:ABC transporter ATP-binding protein n=1 Tax=Sinosporangium siamense TaxID=1367973 RepID=A0A919V7R8_9ACTN|nr:ABC-F family ATP-binding cassette domain-containing protein [Sinosporangium siamense]GII93708.1 ABC transporter ATP-binding protein [Sinosporangium siamense]